MWRDYRRSRHSWRPELAAVNRILHRILDMFLWIKTEAAFLQEVHRILFREPSFWNLWYRKLCTRSHNSIVSYCNLDSIFKQKLLIFISLIVSILQIMCLAQLDELYTTVYLDFRYLIVYFEAESKGTNWFHDFTWFQMISSDFKRFLNQFKLI